MKYFIIIAVVLGLGLWTGASAATKFAERYPRATLWAVVTDKEERPVYKLVDGTTSCYIFGASISCVK
jgi:hypothetical protein